MITFELSLSHPLKCEVDTEDNQSNKDANGKEEIRQIDIFEAKFSEMYIEENLFKLKKWLTMFFEDAKDKFLKNKFHIDLTLLFALGPVYL